MAQLGGTFDANTVEPQGDYTPIPSGEYRAQIIASEMQDNKAQTGQFLKLEIEITDGPQAGRKTFDRLNLINPNQQAAEIAQRTLSAICHATGKLTIEDSEQLHMIPMIVRIDVEERKDKPGTFSNSVKAYKPASGAAAGGSPFTKPAAQQQTTGAAPAADNTPPWKRKAA